tara:strand:+ start:107 stop:454 length:348 start_codon:yes stop_codon:yes gene_type:complete
MAKPKLKTGVVKEIQDLLESGKGVNEVQKITGISKACIGEIYRKERIYCSVCEIAHKGPVRCPTLEERREQRAKEDAKTPPEISPSTTSDRLLGVTDNSINFNNARSNYQNGSGR